MKNIHRVTQAKLTLGVLSRAETKSRLSCTSGTDSDLSTNSHTTVEGLDINRSTSGIKVGQEDDIVSIVVGSEGSSIARLVPTSW